MCGIAGLIHRGKSSKVGHELQGMLQALKHRGEDSTGYAYKKQNNWCQMSNKHLNTSMQSQPSVFRWGAATHVGNIRLSNQDKYGITSNLLAVADGMGGHNGGEVAAEIAVNTLTAANRFNSINEFAYLIQRAHHLIQDRAQENINLGINFLSFLQSSEPLL